MSQTTPFYSDNAYDEKAVASAPELGYRQACIKDLLDEMPSDRASVDETRSFIRSLLQYRGVSHDTATNFCEQLLWTGEELHKTNRENMVIEVQECGLKPSQAGHIVKDLLEVREHYESMQKAKSEDPNAPVVFTPKKVPDRPPGAAFFGIVFFIFLVYVAYRITRFLFS